jgi:geranylgeranyl diphosphate synthase type II
MFPKTKDINQTLRQDITLAVDARLAAFCTEQSLAATAIHPLYGRLWQTTARQVLAGGKRLRPYLVALVAQAYGQEQSPEIIDVAVSWELLHIGLLLHDDIIDRDYVRHGQLNVAGQYLDLYRSVADDTQRLHYAHSAALLAGDLLLSAAPRLIDGCALSERQKQALRDILYQATFEVIGGELLDTEAAIIDRTIDLQLIAQLKTASCSLTGPMLSGAVIAGAPADQQALLRKLGECLGTGFQLVDDLLGVFGSPQVSGKSGVSDLAEGKCTVVIAEALRLMSPENRATALKLLNNRSGNGVERLRSLIAATTVESLIIERLSTYADQAQQLIGQLKIDEEDRIRFHDLATTLLDRSS